MGYSISVSAKSVKAKEDMLAFLQEHFRAAWEIFDHEVGYDITEEGPLEGQHLGYDSGTTKMGFNYSAGGNGSRYYAYCLCRWMALKVGRRFRSELLADDQNVAYIMYDGHESIPVLVRSKWEGTIDPSRFQTTFCDEWGVKPHEMLVLAEQQLERLQNEDDGEELSGLAAMFRKTPKGYIEHLEGKIAAYGEWEESVRDEFKRLDELWEMRGTKQAQLRRLEHSNQQRNA